MQESFCMINGDLYYTSYIKKLREICKNERTKNVRKIVNAQKSEKN